jgi:hypothetical protein
MLADAVLDRSRDGLCSRLTMAVASVGCEPGLGSA